MQPRLTRSRTDVMVAGVCGGLGEYFAVDPVLVRLIFVLVTLTSGLGLPVYMVMWLVMPKGSMPVSGQVPPPASFDARQFGRQMEQFGHQIGQEAAQIGRELREAVASQPRADARKRGVPGVMEQEPPDPSAYNFDPHTGQPLHGQRPSTGQTINLDEPPQMPLQHQGIPVPPPPQAPYHRPQGRNWRTLGFIMIGIGGLIFLSQLDVNLDFIFPLVLIAAGFILMRRRS